MQKSSGVRAFQPDKVSMDHIADQLLEMYALGRIMEEQQLGTIEEHILLCASCQDRLREHDQYIRTVRAALAQFPAKRRNGTLEVWVAIHRTRSGDVHLFYLHAESIVARVISAQVDTGARVNSVREAREWCSDTFRVLFPEHHCGPQCRGSGA